MPLFPCFTSKEATMQPKPAFITTQHPFTLPVRKTQYESHSLFPKLACTYLVKLQYGRVEAAGSEIGFEEVATLGSGIPLINYTNNRNLKYLRTAKHLNPRSSQWALFLTHFWLTLHYRSGIKNTKPDPQSRTHFTPTCSSMCWLKNRWIDCQLTAVACPKWSFHWPHLCLALTLCIYYNVGTYHSRNQTYR